jgi:hypothetical protein
MSLTVTERERWQVLVKNQIKARIQRLWAADNGRLSSLTREAGKQALEELGIAEMMARQEEIEAEKDRLTAENTRLDRTIYEKVTGNDPDSRGYGRSNEVEEAIKTRKKILLDNLLAQDKTGAEVLKLEQECSRVEEAIWLATTTQSIKTLWKDLLDMLEIEAGLLEDKARALPPDPVSPNSGAK